MKPHIKVYMEYFNIGPDDIVLCEHCGKVAGAIHHIIFKSQGGTDDIENLIALHIECHDISHGKIPGKSLTREELFEIVERR
jgi:5-methylcytosine-specific restriction endonuclease McrA